MNATKPIRVGFVGAGTNTKLRHIPGLAAIPGVELVRVCNRSDESSKQVADEFQIAGYTSNWRDVTDADDIDAVVVGTWPYLHHAVSVASLQNRKHVLCEARMAMDSVEARDMLAESRKAPELTAMVVPSPFTIGVDATIKRLLCEGYIGEVVSVDVRGVVDEFDDWDRPVHWRERRELSGNNVLALGIWYEAIVRWLGEASRVCAMGKTVVPTRAEADSSDSSSYHITVPDHLDVVAQMHCGAQLHMQLSSVACHAEPSSVTIYGTEGVLQFDGQKLTGRRRDSGDELEPIQIPESEIGSWRVEEEFIGAIRGTEQVRLTTFEDGVKYMEFTDAVHESMRSGCSVGLPY